MNSITVVFRLCFHSEDSSDFTSRVQSDDIQFQKAFEQFTSERYKVDAQSRPLKRQKQYDFVVTRFP